MAYPFSAAQMSETVTYRDAKGNTGKMLFYLKLGGSATVEDAFTDFSALVPLISALSNAALQTARGPFTSYGVAQYGAHVSGGAYESIIDKAVMVFQDAAGQLHRFEVPAPKIAIFKTDKITVDPANTAVAAFTAFMTTGQTNGNLITSRQALPYLNYMGGFYKARKIRRRLNVLVLQPDLTASLPAE